MAASVYTKARADAASANQPFFALSRIIVCIKLNLSV